MIGTVGGALEAASILSRIDGPEAFLRDDETEDARFYAVDRFVQHLDESALAVVETVIGTLVVEENPVVLDLMAGWDSHLPARMTPSALVGLGMNRREMERNQRITEFAVHDLNRDPRLPLRDASFDAIINTVSVDYLTRPVDVFREAGRILRPGGLFLVLFSNRFFPEKAVRIWKDATLAERVDLVRGYFDRSGAFEPPAVFTSMGRPRPANDKYASLGLPSDPVFAVYADRKGGDPSRPPRPEVRLAEADAPSPEEIERRKREVRNTLCCPYCGERFGKWTVPDDPFVEWDEEFLYICFNDACPYVVNGWQTMHRQGVEGMSYRLMCHPRTHALLPVPIHTLTALKT